MNVKQIVKNGIVVCPQCGEAIPKKIVMRKYRKASPMVKLECQSGEMNKNALPTGANAPARKRCGRTLKK